MKITILFLSIAWLFALFSRNPYLTISIAIMLAAQMVCVYLHKILVKL